MSLIALALGVEQPKDNSRCIRQESSICFNHYGREAALQHNSPNMAARRPLTLTRILAIDFGTRRIGAALSDPDRKIAFPLELYERRGPDLDARHYRELVKENDVDRIVVGLPLHTSGREGELAAQARAFGEWQGRVTGCQVIFFDERYTTVEAEHRLLDAGLTRQKRKALRDKLAAQIMLQSYLDAGCPETECASAPLADPDEVEL
jgi:putative Holliday junction resolvase